MNFTVSNAIKTSAGLFQGFWGKRPLSELGNFYAEYTVFYTGYILYINSQNVVFIDHWSQVNKQFSEFDKPLDHMVSYLFVSMLQAKGISVEMGIFFLEIRIFFSWNWEKWSLSGTWNGAQYRPRETRWKRPVKLKIYSTVCWLFKHITSHLLFFFTV